MKRDSLKRNIILSLTLLTCSNFVPYLSADDMTITPAGSTLSAQDTVYIEQLTQDIKTFIDSVKEIVDGFLNDKVKKSLTHYIALFEQKLSDCETAIIAPHKKHLATCAIDQTSAYYQALKTTDEILMELHTQLKQFHKVITDPKNLVKSINLANKIAEQHDKLLKKYTAIDLKLANLHTHLQQLELSTLMNEIIQIRDMLSKAQNAPQLTTAQKAALVATIDKMMKIK